MTTTKKSAGASQPANMHTDIVTGSGPQAQPLNMHTDIVVTKTGSSVTITGTTDQKGRVSVRLPVGVAAALKQHVTPLVNTAAPTARAKGAAANVVYVLDSSAKVGGTLSSGLTVTGPARSGGTAASVALTISQQALTALRGQRDAL